MWLVSAPLHCKCTQFVPDRILGFDLHAIVVCCRFQTATSYSLIASQYVIRFAATERLLFRGRWKNTARCSCSLYLFSSIAHSKCPVLATSPNCALLVLQVHHLECCEALNDSMPDYYIWSSVQSNISSKYIAEGITTGGQEQLSGVVITKSGFDVPETVKIVVLDDICMIEACVKDRWYHIPIPLLHSCYDADMTFQGVCNTGWFSDSLPTFEQGEELNDA